MIPYKEVLISNARTRDEWKPCFIQLKRAVENIIAIIKKPYRRNVSNDLLRVQG